jgi:xylulose-5-phosphate/fructose-6-phosphate phosphoketolase
MIVLRSPKGWTGPKEVDQLPIEGHWRSHQVPFADARANPEHREVLEAWMRSYRPEELFDEAGRPVEAVRRLSPAGERRMSAIPHANGGVLRKPLRMPDWREHGIEVTAPATTSAGATGVLGRFLRDVMAWTSRTGRSASSPPTSTTPTACRRSWRSPAGPGRRAC